MDTSQTYLMVFVVFLNTNFKVNLRGVKSLILLSIEEPSIGHFDVSFPPFFFQNVSFTANLKAVRYCQMVGENVAQERKQFQLWLNQMLT